MNLRTISVNSLKKTSRVTIAKLKQIGINTFWDLLNYFPFRYEDYSIISPIANIQIGEKVTVQGEVVSAKNIFLKSGLKIQEVIIFDSTDKITLSWFNQIYLIKLFKKGSCVSASGIVRDFGKKKILSVEQYEFIDDIKSQTIHTGRIIPIYSESTKISAKTLRQKIFKVLTGVSPADIQEIFPDEIVKSNNLYNRYGSYKSIHFPETLIRTEDARRRLAFEELFFIQLRVKLIRKETNKEEVGMVFRIDKDIKEKVGSFIASLPFELTDAQKKVIEEIRKDLVKSHPMSRFLQGDVGSGKTVVAAIAAYVAHLNGSQILFMAPTEILASQHYQTISKLFRSAGLKIGLATASHKLDKQKYDIVVGTHALLSRNLSLKKVGLVIIDEQHKFGVNQRAELKKKGINPHLLTMTATPIPRTVALTLYGSVDMSVIDEMPKGRQTVKTYFVPNDKRVPGYQWIKDKIRHEKAQVYIVCPLIEESEIETMKSVRAATAEFENLKRIFSGFKVDLIHGKLRSVEKEKALSDFRNGMTDILVSTSVVEVGIDVPSATIMIIEDAERFGLAQLHQLRGRVGRGSRQSYCFLFSEKDDANIVKRLNFFAKTSKGLPLAEYDLKRRGPGELFGAKQHGYKNLKLASYTDLQLITDTKNAADYFISNYNLQDYPEIKETLDEKSSGEVQEAN